MDEECWGLERGEMPCARLIGIVRRMQGIGKQEQSIARARVVSREHRGLPAAIGMAGGDDALESFGAESIERGAHAGTVVRSYRRIGRAMGTPLAERQIEAQHRETRSTERIGNGNQQRGGAIPACSVRKRETGAAALGGPVQEAAHRRIFEFCDHARHVFR